MMTYPSYKAAVMHVSPVFLDTRATIDKSIALIREAAANNAQLVVFSETFIPAFPIWAAIRSPLKNHNFFKRLAAQSLTIDSHEILQLCEAAREQNVYLSIGFNELSASSIGCIYNSNIIINNEGDIICHHRKTMPTFWEKLVWAQGDGSGLIVNDTKLGKLGMLICGENTNPLARFSLMAQGEQVHISSFPPAWPAHDPNEGEYYDVSDAILIRVRNHSFEGKLFNIVASAHFDDDAISVLADGDKDLERILRNSPQGISLVVGPTGKPISHIQSGEEGIVYADIDVAQCVEPKQLHDVAGYYNRFDIFKLTVDKSHNYNVRFESPSNNIGMSLSTHYATTEESES